MMAGSFVRTSAHLRIRILVCYLSEMQYHEFPVDTRLAEYVQTIWAMDGEEGEVYPRSLIMPDGIVELVFHYADPFWTIRDNQRFLQPAHTAVSMMRKYIEIESNGRTGFIAVRFLPWGAYNFFDKPVSDFLDTGINATTLWKSDSEMIISMLRNSLSLADRVQLVTDFLFQMLQKYQKNEAKAIDALKLIQKEKGMLSIDEVCVRADMPKKQLERKTLPFIGTSPKVFSRVCRFLHICNTMEEHKSKSLTELAYDCGYYDQSHFINEFKEFSGFTPKDFFGRENTWFTLSL